MLSKIFFSDANLYYEGDDFCCCLSSNGNTDNGDVDTLETFSLIASYIILFSRKTTLLCIADLVYL
jgi:hypothetical protein